MGRDVSLGVENQRQAGAEGNDAGGCSSVSTQAGTGSPSRPRLLREKLDAVGTATAA